MIVFRILEEQIQVVGSASGPVACEQTVFRAEAQAVAYLVEKVQGSIEVTLDAKGVKQATHPNLVGSRRTSSRISELSRPGLASPG